MAHRILIVDDEGHIREVIRVALKKAGMDVIEAPAALTIPLHRDQPSAAIVIAAPAHDRLFRLTMTPSGFVQLHEEQTL